MFLTLCSHLINEFLSTLGHVNSECLIFLEIAITYTKPKMRGMIELHFFLQECPIWIDGWRQAEWDVGRPDIWEAENADWFYGCSEPSQNFPCKEIPTLYCKHIDQLDLSSSRRKFGYSCWGNRSGLLQISLLEVIIIKHQNKIADILFRNV